MDNKLDLERILLFTCKCFFLARDLNIRKYRNKIEREISIFLFML